MNIQVPFRMQPSSPALSLPRLLFLTMLVGSLGHPAMAQRYQLGPGSNVGPASEIEADCQEVENPEDGSITVECDTKVVNPPGDTQARPINDPFEY